MSLSAAVLLITSGRPELTHALQSVWNQTYPVTTYVVTDAVIGEDEFQFIKTYLGGNNTHFCYWPTKVGGRGWEGRRLIAAMPSLINEDVTFVLQDDDWFKPDHVASLMSIIEDGHDWAYSLMSVYDKDGSFLLDDICECLGEEHPAWNTGETFAPTGSIAMRTALFRGLAVSAYNHEGYGPDRTFYNLAKQIYPKFKGSKKHTHCFRLGGNDGSSNLAFFERGNQVMREKYPDGMPWE